MIIYLLTLGIVFVLAYFAQTKQKVLEDGVIKKTSTYGKWAIAAVCAVLIFIGGFRFWVGSDYGIYGGFFLVYMKAPLGDVLQQEEGFFWAIATIVGFFTTDTSWVFVVCEAIIILCIIPTMAKYSHNLSLSVFLHLATFDYFSAFNGVRQWVAAAILFASFPLLKEKKIVRYFLMCLFAYLFHNSAILMIPVGVFVLTSPLSKWNVLAVTGIGVMVLLMPGEFENLLNQIVDDKYTRLIPLETNGINILRVIVGGLPMILARILYKQLYTTEKDKSFLNLMINFSTVNFVFLVIASRATFVARMTMYTSPFNCLLIPYLLRAFKKESQFMAKTMIMALFGLYMIMLLPVDAGVLPYWNTFGWKFA